MTAKKPPEEHKKSGRKPQYESAKQMQALIDKYFDYCLEKNRPLTIGGLAYFLDLTRQGVLNYQGRPGFVDAISRAKRKIQLFAEESLYDKERFKGAQFSLKNNHGWKDKQEVEVSGNVGLDSQLIAGRQKVQEALKEKDNDR